MHVTVLITAWMRCAARFDYLCRVLHSLQHFLTASTHHKFDFLIALETRLSDPDVFSACTSYLRAHNISVVRHRSSPNLGANLNNAINFVKAPYVLYVQDDFLMVNTIPMDDDIRVLQSSGHFSIVRYSWVLPSNMTLGGKNYSGTDVPLRLFTTRAPYFLNFQPWLAKTNYFKHVIGAFPTRAPVEPRFNKHAKMVARRQWPGSKILVRGGGPREKVTNKYFHHIGYETTLQEKYRNKVLNGHLDSEDARTRYKPTYPDPKCVSVDMNSLYSNVDELTEAPVG